MNRDISSTKWGRTFVDVGLYLRYMVSWHNHIASDARPFSQRLPLGLSHTVYPDGRIEIYG